tara:strand:- start:4676 stop:6103 length:1428 start_codon:yes stop_codon:yes gene_type:complete
MRWLILFTLLTFNVAAEEITTGNLLPNAGDSASSAQSVDTNVPNVASSCNDFTITNSHCFSTEIEVTGTGTVKKSGSLVGITTNSDTTTQEKLDNGITLNSTTIVQNCEWANSSYACGNRGSGRDTFKTTVKILDVDGSTLASVDQIRNTDAGYYANAHKYTDQVIYNNAGSNQFDWTWTGIDGQSNPGNLGGPNLLGASLTMTYENVVLEVATLTALEEVNEAVSNTEIEQSVSEVVIEETKTLATQVSNIQKAPITKTAKVVQVQQAVKKFEAKTGAKVVKASTTSTTTNTATAAAPAKVAQSPKKEKKATTIAKQIISSTAKKETINEKKEKQEEKKSEVKEEKQEEKQEKKKIVSKTTSSSKSKVSTIDAAMAKVDEVVKDIAKNLEVKNLVKLEAMKGDISLALYTNTEFYKGRDIYLNNNMFDNRDIYNNINLVQYIENDPVAQKEKILKDLRLRERELLFKLEALNNG